MPQLANLVINDGATTPVAHTFKPRSIENGVTTLVESAGSPVGESRITLSHTRNQSGRIRATIKVSRPVVQDATVNGVTRPTLVRAAYADLTFNFDATSSTEERRDMVAMLKNALADTGLIKGFAVDLEGIY
jgi:hypothetical protein